VVTFRFQELDEYIFQRNMAGVTENVLEAQLCSLSLSHDSESKSLVDKYLQIDVKATWQVHQWLRAVANGV